LSSPPAPATFFSPFSRPAALRHSVRM
jgi:hypothetical protein